MKHVIYASKQTDGTFLITTYDDTTDIVEEKTLKSSNISKVSV